MNNYQEALNYLETMTRGKINKTEQYHNDKSSLLAILDLQELIEEHQKNLTYISTLEKTLKETDKALDKACEELEQFEYTLSNYHYNEHKNKEQWKEYFMEESEGK